ncbi:methyltransferase domain-containing protein [Streptomyces sp. NBC_01601]|uniref:methyltransferase domain-containing protein n=1 Tax=Streptomyces sp. NBC_01601 TaxID=2975892 RepID=UPI002E2D8AA1|nr:methyltransferase domain-containing protein [Streptomyces sp. NBC_01601]
MDRVEHGFTAVDAQASPSAWVCVLDQLHREPFYTAYKSRLHGLLQARPGDVLLEVGAGTGEAALSVQRRFGVAVVAVDSALTMAGQCRARGVERALAADAHRLPLQTNSVAGAWADRVLQHVRAPTEVVDEMIRVIRPGGRLALADPDYDTQVLDISDQDLARSVLRYRADHMLRHGTLAHQQAGLLAARGLVDIAVEARTLVVRDPEAVDQVMGLRTWAHTAAERGRLETAQADRFVTLFDEAVAQDRFLYSVTFFLTSATVPTTARAVGGGREQGHRSP